VGVLKREAAFDLDVERDLSFLAKQGGRQNVPAKFPMFGLWVPVGEPVRPSHVTPASNPHGSLLLGWQLVQSSICQESKAKWSVNTLLRPPMLKPPRDTDIADSAPTVSVLTPYDHEHLITYLRLLDADADGADWREVARIVLHRDQNASQIARGGRSRAIYRALNG
jgi:hypothetical protein